MEKLCESADQRSVILKLDSQEYTTLCFLHDAMTGHTGPHRDSWRELFDLLDCLRPVVRSIRVAAHDLADHHRE